MNVLGYGYYDALSEIEPFNFLLLMPRLGTGAAGPAFFGLGVKQCLIILLIVDIM